MQEKDVYKVGQIVKVHGVKGKLEVSYTDDVFLRADIDYLFLKMDGLLVPFFIEECVMKGRGRALVKFEDVDMTERASLLLGAEVYFPVSEIPEREEEPASWDFLTGFSVSDVKEGYVGEITFVNADSANTILFVRRENNAEVLIPLHPELVVEWNEKKRELVMNLPEGLLTLNN